MARKAGVARQEGGGIIPEKEALGIARCVASALDYAWNRSKLLHRDIKPANIMIDKEGLVKLMDMGISKSLDVVSSMTGTMGISVTPFFFLFILIGAGNRER